MKVVLMCLLLIFSITPVQAQPSPTPMSNMEDLKPEIKPTQPPVVHVDLPDTSKPNFAETHPNWYKAAAPLRGLRDFGGLVKNGFISFGKKVEPMQPGMNFLASSAGIAAPFVFAFFGKRK